MSNVQELDNELLAFLVSCTSSYLKALGEQGMRGLAMEDDDAEYTLSIETMFDALQEAKRRLDPA